jgi:hypothetical protein
MILFLRQYEADPSALFLQILDIHPGFTSFL